MHCYHCGSPIPEGLKFCTQCGTPMDEAVEEPMEETLEETVEELPAEASDSAQKPAAEAPEVEELPAAELFEEELGRQRPSVNDDLMFGLDEPIDPREEDAPEEEEEDDDSALDPDSPDFDPRKFAGLDREEFRPIAASELLEEDDEEEDAPAVSRKAPREKKKGHGGIVALVLALVLVLVGAAAGLLYWLTIPVKEAVAEANFSQYMGLEDDATVTAFTVDSRETSRLHRQDTLWCSVTVEDGSTHLECDYVMNYRLTGEGWKLASVDELNTESWILKPLTGASEEEIATALTGQPIKFSDDYTYTLSADDSATAEILTQSTDLEAGIDTVTAKLSVVSELVGWTTEAQLELTFGADWQLTAMTHSDPEVEFKPGMEFELAEADFLEVLAANPMPLAQPTEDVKTTVVTDGEAAAEEVSAAQTVKLTKAAISELTVLETVFDMEENTQTVVVEFMLDKQVAKLQVEAALTYVFEDGWKIDTVTYAPTVKEIVLDGEWKGTYPEVDGRIPGVTLTIGKNEDGTDNNVFSFGPSEANPYFFTGKYYVEALADTETLEVALNATDWVLYYNPGGVTMVDLKGVLMIDDAVITDGGSFTITLQREAPAAEEEAINEDAVAREVVTVEAGTETTAPVKPAETVDPADTAELPAPAEDPADTAAPAEEPAAPVEQAPADTAPETETDTAADNTAPTEEEEDLNAYLGTWDTPIG